MERSFRLSSKFRPAGDQAAATSALLEGLRRGEDRLVLKGVTGSGKTFTMANLIAAWNRPTLILSHNKTLAAQLFAELKEFFPENSVEYFISYYDYYQPEAYLVASDTYIEKDLSINDEIEKLRLHATASLLSGRRDVIVVSSVSCLYGIGNPADFHANSTTLRVGDIIPQRRLLYRFVDALYTRTERTLEPATFRVKGDTIDIMPAYSESDAWRVSMFGDEVEAIWRIDPTTGARMESASEVKIFPANLFVTTKERIDQACLLYTSPSPRDRSVSRMPSSA